MQGFGTLEKETPTKMQLEGGRRRKGKRLIIESTSNMQDKEDVSIEFQLEVELGLGVASLQEVPMISTQTIPIEEEVATLDLQEF